MPSSVKAVSDHAVSLVLTRSLTLVRRHHLRIRQLSIFVIAGDETTPQSHTAMLHHSRRSETKLLNVQRVELVRKFKISADLSRWNLR